MIKEIEKNDYHLIDIRAEKKGVLDILFKVNE